MQTFYKVCLILMIIGGINWGLVGLFQFDFVGWLLENCGVVGTPGVGFGECGEGYFRLTAFGDAEKTKAAAERIKTAIKAL